MEKEKKVYITNRKKGKLITLIGGFFMFSGLCGLLLGNSSGIYVAFIAFVVTMIGKGITWYHN